MFKILFSINLLFIKTQTKSKTAYYYLKRSKALFEFNAFLTMATTTPKKVYMTLEAGGFRSD